MTRFTESQTARFTLVFSCGLWCLTKPDPVNETSGQLPTHDEIVTIIVDVVDFYLAIWVRSDEGVCPLASFLCTALVMLLFEANVDRVTR